MTVMEPRVAERRKTVSEDRARRRLKWILVLMAVAAIGLGSIWLIRSPILSIRDVEVTGAVNSNPRAAISTLEMDIGTPTIDVDITAIAARIAEDPWVGSVDVRVLWPGSIVIDVTERVPVAPVLVGDRWMLLAIDGGVIMEVPAPVGDGPIVVIDQGSLVPGDVVDDPSVLGALAFVGQLSETSRAGARLRVEGEGLVGEVRGHAIRLGRPVDMAQKASVLEALLDSGIEPGASIDLIAPLRPAVTNPEPQPEVEE